MKGCPELRAELERLVNPPGGAAAVRLDAQVPAIVALGAEYHHGIALEEQASIARQRTNCFMHALGIEAEKVEDRCSEKIHPGADFVAWVIANKLVPKLVEPAKAIDGDLILYLDEAGRPLHAGVVRGGQIISKWGSRATHIWRHGVFEIPTSYGNDARVYGPILPEQAERAFREWAEPRL